MSIYEKIINLNALTNMKRYYLILILFLVIQSVYGVKIVSADDKEISSFNSTQQKESRDEIKNVIEAYLQSFAKGDIDSMMSQVSREFLSKNKNGDLDYNGFRSTMEALMEREVDVSLSDIEINFISISDDKVTVIVKHKFKAYDLNKLIPEDRVMKLRLVLVKEEKSWKIVSRNAIQ